MGNSNPDARHGPDNPFGEDPFGEDFFLIPYEEEIRARAEQILQDNLNAVRHNFELLTWGISESDSPELIRVLIPLVWVWPQIAPEWIAEASFMSVGDVCALAESADPPIWSFHCLDCGVQLRVRDRNHRIQLQRRLEAVCRGDVDDHLADLLCEKHLKQREEHTQEQRRFDLARRQALLRDYRRLPYGVRRDTEEWAVTKKLVHRRDGHRCRLCNRSDLPLHVHHRTYKRYAEEKLEDLITLCSECHANFHRVSKVS